MNAVECFLKGTLKVFQTEHICFTKVKAKCFPSHTSIIEQVTWLVITGVRNKSFGLVTERRHEILVICADGVTHTFAYWTFFTVGLNARHIFHRRVWYRALSLRYAWIRRPGIILTLGYLCAKFRFFRGLRCWASPWRIIAYSITHSLTHPAYLMPREPKLSLQKKT